jgi:hypothetical protein
VSAPSAAAAAETAAAAGCIAALGERERSCRIIVKALTEQQLLLQQAIEEEVYDYLFKYYKELK